MKKLQSKRISKPKASNGANAVTVDEYFAKIKGPAHEMLSEMRSTIRSAVPPGATEVISYGIPAFKQKKVLVWYAAFANHCSLFPGGAVLDQMKSDLEGFTTSKGTIQFRLDKPLPTGLVRKIVKERLMQVNRKP